MRKIINQKSFQLFIKLKSQGYSHFYIANILNCSLSTVSRMAKHYKINGENLDLLKVGKK